MAPARILCPPRNERGIALVMALLVLLLTAVLSGTFMAVSTSERAISSNVHIARASLSSADAGVRVAQQMLANRARAQLDSLCLVWIGTGPIVRNPDLIFPGGVTTVSSGSPGFAATATVQFADSVLADTSQVYLYEYTITSTGTFGAVGQRQVMSTGVLQVSAERGSFADYLLFVDRFRMKNGTEIWFNSTDAMFGRVHTNGKFSFAYQPTFSDLVTQDDNEARFFNRGSPVSLAADHNGTNDNPNFFGGFRRNSGDIPLPGNNFNQQNAALGLDPSSAVAPASSTIETQIGWSGHGHPPDGVYLPNTAGDVTGGIYVIGDIDLMKLEADTTNNVQIYRIEQGGNTTIVTIDAVHNRTSVDRGSGPVVYNQTPRGCLYVEGGIDDLRGPNRSGAIIPPAILDGHQLLIAANDNLLIQRDITVQNFDRGRGVLGLFTTSGDILVGTGAPNDVALDMFMMATGSGGAEFGVDRYNHGGVRGTIQLRGGMVSVTCGATGTMNHAGTLLSGFGTDFRYDRRGVIPPYFPTTGRFSANVPRARTLAWKEI